MTLPLARLHNLAELPSQRRPVRVPTSHRVVFAQHTTLPRTIKPHSPFPNPLTLPTTLYPPSQSRQTAVPTPRQFARHGLFRYLVSLSSELGSSFWASFECFEGWVANVWCIIVAW